MPDYKDDDDDYTDIGDGPPHLDPLFPVASFTPESACPHQGAIRRGSTFCCMVCEKSGKDHYRYFRRPLRLRKAERPAARPTRYVSPAAAAKGKETRKERRARLKQARGHTSDLAALPRSA